MEAFNACMVVLEEVKQRQELEKARRVELVDRLRAENCYSYDVEYDNPSFKTYVKEGGDIEEVVEAIKAEKAAKLARVERRERVGNAMATAGIVQQSYLYLQLPAVLAYINEGTGEWEAVWEVIQAAYEERVRKEEEVRIGRLAIIAVLEQQGGQIPGSPFVEKV